MYIHAYIYYKFDILYELGCVRVCVRVCACAHSIVCTMLWVCGCVGVYMYVCMPTVCTMLWVCGCVGVWVCTCMCVCLLYALCCGCVGVCALTFDIRVDSLDSISESSCSLWFSTSLSRFS